MGAGVQGSKEECFLTIFIFLKEGFPKSEEEEETGESERIGGGLVVQSCTLKGGVVLTEGLRLPKTKRIEAQIF